MADGISLLHLVDPAMVASMPWHEGVLPKLPLIPIESPLQREIWSVMAAKDSGAFQARFGESFKRVAHDNREPNLGRPPSLAGLNAWGADHPHEIEHLHSLIRRYNAVADVVLASRDGISKESDAELIQATQAYAALFFWSMHVLDALTECNPRRAEETRFVREVTLRAATESMVIVLRLRNSVAPGAKTEGKLQRADRDAYLTMVNDPDEC